MEQWFGANPLDRSAGDRKDPNFILNCVKLTCSWIIHHRSNTMFSDGSLALVTNEDILTLSMSDSLEDLCLSHSVLVLGQLNGKWIMSVDITEDAHEKCLASGFKFLSPRHLLTVKSNQEASMAGQVVALYSWHKSARYLGSSGEETVLTEGGSKRSGKISGARVYARTDPVAIACVISKDGQRCLLGKMKRSPKGFFSCLSGFIEPCESVEQAVRREVMEEAGIFVGEVSLVRSQPWPLGRGGTCELMLGCLAVAESEDIHITESEVEEVRWMSKVEVRGLLEVSTQTSPFTTSTDCRVPGQYAIAHHLLQMFVDNDKVISPGSNSYAEAAPNEVSSHRRAVEETHRALVSPAISDVIKYGCILAVAYSIIRSAKL